MVQLILSSRKGNQGLRYFPYSGYLGLTPILVEGVVRTKLDADLKTLQAKSISVSVRCYETRTGRVNVLQSNILVDYTKVLWSKPDGVEYGQIGDSDFRFCISMPAKVAGFSTAVFVDYRCIWRVEAVLTHVPMSGVGSRQIRHFELPLVRYDVPSRLPFSPTPPIFLGQQTTKPRAPRIRYSINSPRTPIGPLDLVSIPIHLQPLDSGVSIRSASATVERRIQLLESSSSSSSSLPSGTLQADSPSLTTPSSSYSLTEPKHSYSPTQSYQEPRLETEPISSTLSLNSSNPTLTPGTVYPSATNLSSETSTPTSETAPLIPSISSNYPNPNNQQFASLQSPSSSAKIVADPVVGVESSGSFSRDTNGVYSKTLTLQWPAAKSHSRWAIGETITSNLVSVKYFIRTKIIVTSPSGTETIELADQELFILSTNDTERQVAISKYNERCDAVVVEGTTRSKSKSPRRTRADHPEPPPTPSTLANVTNGSDASSSKQPPSHGSGTRTSKSRRPHTSAGPRDKPVSFAGGAYGRPRGEEGEVSLGQVQPLPGNNSSAGSSSSTAAKRRSDMVIRTVPRPDSRDSHMDSKKQTSSLSITTSSSSKLKYGLGLGSGGSNGSKLSSTSFWSTVHSNGTVASVSTKAPRVKGVPSGSSTSTTASSSSISSGSHASASESSEPSEHMREWEEELARIEIRSRRSSDLLGFSGKRKRSVGAPRVFSPDNTGVMGIGYALMKATTPTEEQLYNQMAPDLRRKVDASRAARQARELEVKKQVEAQVTNDTSPETMKPIWAEPPSAKK